MKRAYKAFLAPVLCLMVGIPASAQQDSTGVRPVRAPLSKIMQASKNIDLLIERKLDEEGIRPNPPLGDEAFLRRIYLTAAGRIPTLKEQNTFLRSTKPNKRSALIDQLLNSQAYVHNQYINMADLLRVKERFEGLPNAGGLKPGIEYAKWIKEALRENMPWNRMAYELVNARGGLWEKGNGAAAYYFRDYGMPLDNMSNTSQIFLGTQMQCAQCHDHPFDKWSQMDFYHMAAFTDGLGNMTDSSYGKVNNEVRRQVPREEQTQDQRNLMQMAKHLYLKLDHGGTGQIRLPKDYQYDDAKPGERVAAKPIFGGDIEIPELAAKRAPEATAPKKGKKNSTPDVGSREAFAKWMIHPENPRFTKVIANRLWKQVMGRGVFEPVDDLREDTVINDPQLMAYLERIMVGVRYDTKEFLRILYNTRTFQRAVPDTEISLGEPYYFPGPIMRRLSAEQMWDSLMALTRSDVDAVKPVPEHYMTALYAKARRESPEDMADFLLTLPEKMAGKNGKMQMGMMQSRMNDKMGFDGGPSRDQLRREIQAIQKKAKAFGREKKWDKAKAEQKKLSALYAQQAALNHWRAAELSNPPPPGHFIREFGGSDRLVIDGGGTEASISQVLSLLNGFVDNYVLRNRHSVLMRELAEVESSEARVILAFKMILGRSPYPWEIKDLEDHVDPGPRGTDNLVWALINTHEFMSWK